MRVRARVYLPHDSHGGQCVCRFQLSVVRVKLMHVCVGLQHHRIVSGHAFLC
jgi:hypothetical protein